MQSPCVFSSAAHSFTAFPADRVTSESGAGGGSHAKSGEREDLSHMGGGGDTCLLV